MRISEREFAELAAGKKSAKPKAPKETLYYFRARDSRGQRARGLDCRLKNWEKAKSICSGCQSTKEYNIYN